MQGFVGLGRALDFILSGIEGIERCRRRQWVDVMKGVGRAPGNPCAPAL